MLHRQCYWKSKNYNTLYFDEAGMTLPKKERSPANMALIQHGYSTQGNAIPDSNFSAIQIDSDQQNIAYIKLLTDQATMPMRATDGSAGFDVYSATALTISPNERKSVPLDISIISPQGMYTQIMPRSGLAYKHGIDTKAGVIDRDYTGNIQVILHNAGNEQFTITKGDRVVQIIFYHIGHPTLGQTQTMAETKRAENIEFRFDIT
jgi:dUTP pyrophosphatase